MPANKDQKRGTWVCRFEYKDWKGETRTVYKRGFPTRRDAVQYEMDFKLRLAGDLDMSFADFVKVYREERYARLRESTSSMKDYIIEDKILPYFGRMKMREISSTDVVRWQNELLGFKKSKGGESYSRTYLKTVHNQLSAIFNYAVRYYHLQNNPARIAGNIGNESEIEMDFWTLEEYKKFSAVMAEKPEYFYAFEVLYWLGLREGELLALTRQDFDLENMTVSITKTYQVIRGKESVGPPKTPKGKRVVIMPQELCEEMKDYFGMRYDLKDNERVFTMTKHGLYHEIQRGSKIAGVKRIRVHDLRHSHVSLLINMGYSAVAIGARVGHESTDITYKYAHLFPTVQSALSDKLNHLMKGNESDDKENN